MRVCKQSHVEIVDELIRRRCSFALYRMPGETTPRFLMQRQ